MGSIAPSRPCTDCSVGPRQLCGPAVKKSVCDEPASASFPNASDQRPLMEIGLWFRPGSNPSSSQVPPCPRQAPRLVQLRPREPREEPPVPRELVDVAAVRRVVAVDRRAPREGDEQM